MVVVATLPSHIVNDCSLFTTYAPGRRVHRTAFGYDIIVEGTGDVHIRVFAARQYACELLAPSIQLVMCRLGSAVKLPASLGFSRPRGW